jgi:RNA 2',3'-cyclic 3'-phosphodiesterase
MESIRAFLAIEPDREARSWLETWLTRLRGGWPRARWVAAEHLHLTLKFLGDLAADRVEEVKSISSAVARAMGPFHLLFGAPGWFGPRQRPRTFWLGFEPGPGLDQLMATHRSLERALAERALLTKGGWPPEDRPFSPHLTVGRNPRQVPAGGWTETLPPWTAGGTPGFPCRELTLFASTLTPQGPIHRILEEFRFEARA